MIPTLIPECADSWGLGVESSDALITERKFDKTFSSSSYARSERQEIVQPSLTCLNMTDNKIGPPGLIEIAIALRKNNSLRTLILSDNRCEDHGATALANSLKHNTSVESMFFYDNTIDLEAMNAVTEILSTCIHLKHTDMVLEVGHDLQKRHERIAQASSQPAPIQGALSKSAPPRADNSDLPAAYSKATPKRAAEVPPPQSPLALASPVRQDFGFLDDEDIRGELGVKGISGGTARTNTSTS